MKRFVTAVSLGLIVLVAWGSAQITVTSPSARTNVKAAPDYATEVLRDPWDMNERTDFGWRIFNTVEQYPSYLSNIVFSGGLFSAQTAYTSGGGATYSDVNISILDSAYPGTAVIGKFGSNYPIDADKYTVLAIRMYLTPPIGSWPEGQLYWSRNTIYNDITVSGDIPMFGGWYIYLIDIPLLGTNGLSGFPWAGKLDSLRFDPIVTKDKTIQIDWMRLVQKNALYEGTATWTGNAGNVDIYLDNDANAGNGNLGMLKSNQPGNSTTFLAGGLAPGDYYIAVAPTGSTTFAYSAGYFHVNDTPIISITKPSEEGSDQDFITVKTGNPWDMNAASDIDLTMNLSNPQFTLIDYQDMAGHAFAGNTVFQADSIDAAPGNVGDPIVFFLNFMYRGATYKIDPVKYHRLTFKMGIAGVHSTNDGSMARVMWRRSDESVENVSADIVVRHLPGTWIMNKLVADLATIPLETGAGSPSHSGWTGLIDSLRIDPHEFSTPRSFFFDDVRIAADWTADASFTIQWAAHDADGGATVALYYDNNASGFDGTLIASGLAASAGSYAWNTSAVPGGTYYVYAVISDGANDNRVYSGGPVIISHAGGGVPAIGLSKTAVYLGAIQNGAATETDAVLVTNAGTGVLSWQASTNRDWISVTPASGGHNTLLQIGASRTNFSPGAYAGSVTVQDVAASNSPQLVSVVYNVYGSGTDSAPYGAFDTPLNGANVASSIAVTGWALDDVQVTRVQIKRAVHAVDPPGTAGADGLVYIGDGVFVQGSRSDVQALNPTMPRNDRAGWGYMLLTNFLPNGGNGTYTLYAIAEDGSGHKTTLGQKTINVNNAAAVKPFGAIDTPTQGGLASGSLFYNFGWALTPMPNAIPTDGSTLNVFVDGVPLGHPAYNNYRGDIATLFPGYANSGGAVGVFNLNTTGFSNGTHTIAWSVRDNAGNEDGIGSRYFQVYNAGSPAPQADASAPAADVIPAGATAYSLRGQGRPLAVFSRSGYDANAPWNAVAENDKQERVISVGELERIEIRCGEADGVGGARFRALQVVGDELRALPVGSSFDPAAGTLAWQIGPGFLGSFRFLLLREEGTKVTESALVEVRIAPGIRR